MFLFPKGQIMESVNSHRNSFLDNDLEGLGTQSQSCDMNECGHVDPIVEGILAAKAARERQSEIPNGWDEIQLDELTPQKNGNRLVWEQMRRLFPDLDGEPGQYCIACLSTDLTPAGNFRVVCAKCGRFVRWRNSG